MTRIDGVNDAARSLREPQEDRVRNAAESPREASDDAQAAASEPSPSFRERLDAHRRDETPTPQQPNATPEAASREPAPPQIMRVAQDVLVGDDVTVAHRYESSTETGAVTRDLAPTHHTAAGASAAVVEGGAAQPAPTTRQAAPGHPAPTAASTPNASASSPSNESAKAPTNADPDAQTMRQATTDVGERVTSEHAKSAPTTSTTAETRSVVETLPSRTPSSEAPASVASPGDMTRAAGRATKIDAATTVDETIRQRVTMPTTAQEAPIGRAPSTTHSPVAAAATQNANDRPVRAETNDRGRDDRSRRESSPVHRAESMGEGARREAAPHPAFELRMDPAMDDLRPQPVHVTKSDGATGGVGVASAESMFGEAEGPVARAASRGLAAALRQQGGTVSLRLQPETLGDLRVRMTIDAGSVSVEMSASTDEARDALETSLDALKRSLESRGLDVSRMDVGVHKPAPEQDDRARSRESSRRNEDPFGRPTRRNESAGESLLRLAVNMVG